MFSLSIHFSLFKGSIFASKLRSLNIHSYLLSYTLLQSTTTTTFASKLSCFKIYSFLLSYTLLKSNVALDFEGRLSNLNVHSTLFCYTSLRSDILGTFVGNLGFLNIIPSYSATLCYKQRHFKLLILTQVFSVFTPS